MRATERRDLGSPVNRHLRDRWWNADAGQDLREADPVWQGSFRKALQESRRTFRGFSPSDHGVRRDAPARHQPNTTESVTAKLLDAGRAIAPPGIEIIGASGRFGARYISTRTAAAVAGHAALDAYAPHAGEVDGVLLACFGDPGLLALRELAVCPVLGLAEASCREAAKGGRRYSIITGGKLWPAMLQELLASLGLAGSLASIRAVAPTGGEIAANPAAAHDVLAAAALDAVREDGAEAVILGGAGLVGIAAAIRNRIPVPVLCSVEAGFQAAFAMLEGGQPRSASAAVLPPVGTIGLAPALAALLEGSGTA